MAGVLGIAWVHGDRVGALEQDGPGGVCEKKDEDICKVI